MKFIKNLFKTLISIIILTLCYVLVSQGFTKIYKAPTSKPFTGERFYNPYQGIDSAQWSDGFLKSNFHAHTNFDVTGDYTPEEFRDAYILSNYDLINISDHNFITPAVEHRIKSLDSYEHGYNINNFHQLMMGVSENDMMDIPFMIMPRHQMQYLTERLAPQATLFSFNHPERLRLLDKEVVRDLRGWSVMELNPNADPTYWDMQLSEGNYVAMICNDDAHSITNRTSWFQRAFTMVFPDGGENVHDIIKGVKRASTYGLVIEVERNQQGPHKDMPWITGIELDVDTLSIGFSEIAQKIEFVAQNGMNLYTVEKTDHASLVIPKDAQYVRIQATMDNGVRIFTNAIARSEDGLQPQILPIPESIEWLRVLNTIFWALLGVVLFIVFMLIIWRKRKPKQVAFEYTRRGAGQKTYDPN
ncbi:MAG: hypothetical protein R3Y19_00125 [Rikenellaceae bacterium]